MEQVTDIEHHDRVAEVYFREAFSKAAQDKLIRRIDWICDTVEGEKVLDIGCSQGVVEYLLAQKEKRVVGVDIDDVAISYAKSLLDKLPDCQSKNIELICSDIYQLEEKHLGKFDTVLMTEVIEHIDSPRSLILKCKEFCKSGGLLIITTPFGLHRAPDHKFTFYNNRLESCLNGVGKLVSIDITDKYYCIVIRVSGNGNFEFKKEHDLLQEDAFEVIENRMQDNIEHLAERVRQAKEDYFEQKAKTARVQESLGNYKEQNEKYRNRLAELKNATSSKVMEQRFEKSLSAISELLNTNYSGLRDQMEGLSDAFKLELQNLKSQNQLLSKEKDIIKTENEGVRALNEGFKTLINGIETENERLKIENSRVSDLVVELEGSIADSRALVEQLKFDNEQAKIVNEKLKVKSITAEEKLRDEMKLLKTDQSVNDLLNEKRSLKISKTKSVRRFNAIRDSFSYQFGYLVVSAFTRPGIKTVLLPFSIMKLLIDSILQKPQSKKLETLSKKVPEDLNKTSMLHCDALGVVEKNPSNIANQCKARKSRQDADASCVEKLPSETISNSSTETSKYSKIKVSQKVKEKAYQYVLNEGLHLPPINANSSYEPTDTVFYICHMSMPLMTNGYATRTHHLVKAMQSAGINVMPYTRLGYPLDLNQLAKKIETTKYQLDFESSSSVDGVNYNLLKLEDYRMNNLSILDYLYAYSDAIVEQALIHKPKLIHAASDYRNGVAALIAGRKLGIPVSYEVRGMWHITQASKDIDYAGSTEYKFLSKMEELVAANAQTVFTLTNALESLFINAGIDQKKIKRLANGVEIDFFKNCKSSPSEKLIKKFELSDKVVLGYVGSIIKYEGLDLLLQSIAKLVSKSVTNIKLIIVGDGEYLQELITLTEELSLKEYVVFTGRVPHEEVYDYYSVIDITPFPRLPLEVCELVSPIKPMEAMACGAAVVVSSVGGLSEMVEDCETGLVFEKGDSDDLAVKLEAIIKDKSLADRLTKNAFSWVDKNRSWSAIVNNVLQEFQGKASSSL